MNFCLLQGGQRPDLENFLTIYVFKTFSNTLNGSIRKVSRWLNLKSWVIRIDFPVIFIFFANYRVVRGQKNFDEKRYRKNAQNCYVVRINFPAPWNFAYYRVVSGKSYKYLEDKQNSRSWRSWGLKSSRVQEIEGVQIDLQA